MAWFYNGHESKSLADLDNLVHEVIQAEDFRKEDLESFSAKKVVKEMDESLGPKFDLLAEDGWIEASVEIPLPAEGVKQPESNAPKLKVDGVFYRKPLEVIKSVFQSERSQKFQYVPFKLFQRHGPDPEGDDTANVRLHHELYNSDAYIEEYERIQKQQHERRQSDPKLAEEPEVENVPVGIMAWSDETQVTQFGDHLMWPIYLYLGNQSKYERAKPTLFSAHHVAYIPKLLSNVQDRYQNKIGFPASSATLTHLKRELMQAIWALILDPEFMHAYEHGILLKCGDGVTRRLFPRFFTYSVDYPEKVLLATIRSLGRCPCPHCLVEKDQIGQLGTYLDRRRRQSKVRVDSENRRSMVQRIRRWIFDFGYRIASHAVEVILQPFSYTPTVNTFSERFYEFGVNFFLMFVPDVLHELELGVWKAVLVHLIRILFAYGNDTVQELDARYRQVPTFGRDTIRKIRNNASSMKHLVARDFEDMLQVSIPVFEGLVPEHNKYILTLLFDLCTFHCLAKFRLHSDISLRMLDEQTTELGKSLRAFDSHVCKAYDTREIPKETAACGRRNAKKVNEGNGKGKRKATNADPIRKLFNLCTYKIHALGHYIGELEHRRVKRFYARTNRTFKFVRQITALEKRKRVIESIKLRQQKTSMTSLVVPFEHSHPVSVASAKAHYKISDDSSVYKSVLMFMEENVGDPAIKDFYSKLKEHFYIRLFGKTTTDAIAIEEWGSINLQHDRIYSHKVFRVNYTTYDMRRSQDSINPRTSADIMVRSSDPDTPYCYACVHMDVLWVCWFNVDCGNLNLKSKELPMVNFIDASEECAFGFIDPNDVIRAAHLIPVFHLGKTREYMGRSKLGRKESDKDEDWTKYYIGVFSDRDMFARFVPRLGQGHMSWSEVERDEDVIVEEDTSDINTLMDELIPEIPPAGDENEVEVDEGNEDELMDYGYMVEDEEDEEDEIPLDEAVDLGPDDGEDPINHDMDILDMEGYGLL
ncbi:hypothetical protein K435DRAFT_820957 [Dendrothele bispora CBS 962.96]|uniref:Uncharacterized protein n=1 Tax=Dendrothele bispora (strain CBS 962.96) TaxID=1314807 RepID=A0A4S8LP47_DENBC|nr:hypothetical protein K435DRAFT_820957 [Dendrothele bispora CBS 962.96]